VTISPQTDPGFAFAGVPADEQFQDAAAPGADPLGLLAHLLGDADEATWKGPGFNTIWRPHPIAPSGQDRFLEMNITTDKIAFSRIKGNIPNRGLLMPGINLFGLTYMQQIHQEADEEKGLHIEPGIWINIPHTSNPAEPPTVARLASIPHGTAILAQGTTRVIDGPPNIPDNNILPFFLGTPKPTNADFHAVATTFPELNLSISTTFREKPDSVDQAMVINPNSVLQHAIAGKTITRTTVLNVSTAHKPIAGGGLANTAFLESATPGEGNAKAVAVHATFWIESVAASQAEPEHVQIQYSQLVQLDFNGIRWPHVTVATLRKL
jgi:hypothetical protein